MTDRPSLPRRASLELLRAEAGDELSVLIEERLRDGEDPWDFMEDLPSVDELVVLTLRAENIAADGGNRPTVARISESCIWPPASSPTVASGRPRSMR